MALSDLTIMAVNKAIEEFAELGREAFLQKYKFGKARGYLLEKHGRFYDSKAITAAAHGFLPDQVALAAEQFSGGVATVETVLTNLGFKVVRPALPSPGDILSNEDV
jgi:5-methylcytosine-specific restriction enzyme A